MLGLLVGLFGLVLLWLIIVPTLPPVEALRNVELQVPLRIYSADHKLITTVGEQRRIPLSIDEMPTLLKQAFIAAEDGDFYDHPGFDWSGTLRGVFGYVRYMGQRRVPGGSTITQQVARRFFLSPEYSVVRKIKEIFLAIRIERELSKDEILELYLNKEFLGHRAYGVGAAAQIYYNKSVDELTLAEMAMLAGLPQRPSVVNPVTNPEAALERRAYVLRRMLEEGFIDEEAWRKANSEPDHARIHGPRSELDAPWIAEIARRMAVDRFGASEAYTRGYVITTTVRSPLQQAATRAVLDGLDDYDRRHGWRGPEQQLDATLLQDRSALMQRLQSIAPVGGLRPAVVLESGPERAALIMADGERVTLGLEQVAWARRQLGPDALGAAPETVDEVLPVGAVVRLRRNAEDQWQLAQIPEAQAALVAVDPYDGAVLALVGGLDFTQSQFNRATQSRRQPGSAFKPFIYSAALDHGYTPATIVNDAPIVFDDPNQERAWRPENFSERFHGPTRLREGMIHSRNLISVRVVMDLGLDRVRRYVQRFGFDPGELPDGPAMALGAGAVPPVRLAGAYASFANDGFRVEPYFIEAIIDPDGRELALEAHPVACESCVRVDAAPAQPTPGSEDAADTGPRTLALSAVEDDQTTAPAIEDAGDTIELVGPPVPTLAEQVLSEQTAWLMRSMMSDVIRRGTGRRALVLERSDLAGKTGTSNEQRDTWFAGFNPELVTVVWVGRDDFESLGRLEQGGRTALPIWIDFMREALDGRPEQPDPMPPGIVEALIDPDTGLRVRPGTPGAIREWFPADRLPPLKTTESERDETAENPYDIF
ncbi:MAG: penicillin-binding protein 1A [Wenzhouxiangellaceae bacterium]